MKKSLLFIVNPTAGRTQSKGPLFDAVSVFSDAGYLVRVRATAAHGDATAIAKEEGGEYDVVACCGGDGTLNETVDGLMRLEHPPVLGYIPAGTTNDFATSLGIPKNMEKAARTAVDGLAVHVDVGRLNERHFAYVAAFGAFTDVAYATPQDAKNILGKLAYLVEGAQRLTSLQTITCIWNMTAGRPTASSWWGW